MTRRCRRCNKPGHYTKSCGRVKRPYKRPPRRAGFCVLCPRTVVVKRIYDPDTGLILEDTLQAFCAVHWHKWPRKAATP